MTFFRRLNFFTAIVLLLSLQACATNPVPFDQAAKNLANKLLREVQIKSLLSSSKVKKLVVDDFTDEDSGEVITASQEIEDIIFAEAEKNFRKFSLSKMNSKNISYADYMINGVISLERHSKNHADKFYHVFASVTDLESGKIIAKSSAWVSGKNLNYTPIKEYHNSPMFLTDQRHKSKVVNARGISGAKADTEYYDTIETNALLLEASNAYGQGQYPKAIDLFERAAQRSDGQIMKTYAGLYQTYLKLGDEGAAEDAFGKLVEISVLNNSLSVKLLFKVNSTDFIADSKLRSRYKIWIRQISRFFDRNNYCTHIVGHSSRTGSEEYNNRLSKARALAVQKTMSSYLGDVKAKTRIVGKGFNDNIKGLGTDDGRDAIDRRVEFKIIDCLQI